MIEVCIPVNVPEDRRVIVPLPQNVPTGPATITVRIDAAGPKPLEVRLEGLQLPMLPRSGVVRESQ